MLRELPRRFHLRRVDDVHGVSGTGIVAEGVQFSSGYCALTWLTPYFTGAFYHSADVIEKVHGHNGATILEWDDEPHQKADDSNDDAAEKDAG